MRERLKIQLQKTTTTTYTQPNLAQKKQDFSIGAAQPQIATEQGHDISRISLRPQAKLTVSQPGDVYEQEAPDLIQRVSDSEVNPVENSTNSPTSEADPSSPEVPPELAGKTIQISIELPPPAPIEVPLEDIEPSPEYIDMLDKPLSDSDTVMAKLLPGIIQRDDDKPGLGIDVEANSFSFTATALYRNSNLYTFNNLLGRGNSLEIGFIPQFQWSYDGQKAAYQIGIPMLNQHFQLFKGNVMSELEAGISSVLTTSSVGGQAQLQLHLLKFGEISVVSTGSLTYTREGGTGKLEPDGNISTQISITF